MFFLSKLKRINFDILIFSFFLLFLFFLPLYEAPKNIFSVLFVAFGSIRYWFRDSSKIANFSRKRVIIFVLLVITPFFAGLNSDYLTFPERFFNSLNWALMPLVAVVFLLARYSRSRVISALRMVCVSAVVGVVQAFVEWNGLYPELHSVGHVNQSAVFLCIALLAGGLLIAVSSKFLDRLLVGLVGIAVWSYLGPSLSIIAVAATCFIVAGAVGILLYHGKYVSQIRLFLGFAGIALLLGLGGFIESRSVTSSGMIYEISARLSSDDIWSKRDKIFNTAIAVAGDSAFGFGIQSFRKATFPDRLKEMVATQGLSWETESEKYWSTNHGHNLFSNILVERGWFGVFFIALFLAGVSREFLISRPNIVAGFGLLIIATVVLIGLGQSTLHVEHGQLSFLLLSFCLTLLDESVS